MARYKHRALTRPMNDLTHKELLEVVSTWEERDNLYRARVREEIEWLKREIKIKDELINKLCKIQTK